MHAQAVAAREHRIAAAAVQHLTAGERSPAVDRIALFADDEGLFVQARWCPGAAARGRVGRWYECAREAAVGQALDRGTPMDSRLAFASRFSASHGAAAQAAHDGDDR